MQRNDIRNIYDTRITCLVPGTTYEIAYNQINDNDKIFEIGCAAGYW